MLEKKIKKYSNLNSKVSDFIEKIKNDFSNSNRWNPPAYEKNIENIIEITAINRFTSYKSLEDYFDWRLNHKDKLNREYELKIMEYNTMIKSISKKFNNNQKYFSEKATYYPCTKKLSY